MSNLDQVAVVTGGSSGIGLAVAEGLLVLGARVALLARRPEPLAAAAAFLSAKVSAGEVIALEADVGDEASVEAAFQAVAKRLGPVDILVNNAGIVHRAELAQHTTEDFDAVIRTNLRGAFLCTRAVLPSMIARGGGRIVNVSSISGTLGTPGLSAYCASKWGLLGLTKSVAEEVRAQGILVAAVCPGSVDTEMLRRSLPDLTPDMSPAEAARPILFLASEAPLAMTGAALEIFG